MAVTQFQPPDDLQSSRALSPAGEARRLLCIDDNQCTMRRSTMEEKNKRKAVQVKLSPPELNAFQNIMKNVRAKTYSDAIRSMMVDEQLTFSIAKANGSERKHLAALLRQLWASQGRPSMLQSLLKVNGTDLNVLNNISDSFQDLDALVQGVLWNSSNLANSLNQIAHIVNIANADDPSDADTWEWVIDALNTIMPAVNDLRTSANEVRQFIRGDGSHDSD